MRRRQKRSDFNASSKSFLGRFCIPLKRENQLSQFRNDPVQLHSNALCTNKCTLCSWLFQFPSHVWYYDCYYWWKSWLTTLVFVWPQLASSSKSICCLCYRLCNDKRLAEEVVRLEGLGRLVELCKNESARVGSDGVLVACLAAVRKIAAAVGPEKFKNLDATELVEPRLLDSFLIFSSRNESFVWIGLSYKDWMFSTFN